MCRVESSDSSVSSWGNNGVLSSVIISASSFSGLSFAFFNGFFSASKEAFSLFSFKSLWCFRLAIDYNFANGVALSWQKILGIQSGYDGSFERLPRALKKKKPHKKLPFLYY